MIQQRGQLTDRVKARSIELFGYEITQDELRLLPYLQYVMVNEQKINIHSINDYERKCILKWEAKGYIGNSSSKMKVSKEFWDIMCETIYLGYVDLIYD
jgi:hypothetical protein